jgi:hypothetical protein
MNAINMPGFVAASSLYKTEGHYRSLATQHCRGLEKGVVPQIYVGGGGGDGGWGGSLGWSCSWHVALVPCTLCIPFTSWCWEDECLVLTFDCSGVSGGSGGFGIP